MVLSIQETSKFSANNLSNYINIKTTQIILNHYEIKKSSCFKFYCFNVSMY